VTPPQLQDSSRSVIFEEKLQPARNHTHIGMGPSCLVADKRAVSDNQRTAAYVNGAALKLSCMCRPATCRKCQEVSPSQQSSNSRNSTHRAILAGCLVADERAGMNLNFAACASSINSSSLVPIDAPITYSRKSWFRENSRKQKNIHSHISGSVALKRARLNCQSARNDADCSSLKQFQFPAHRRTNWRS